MSMIQPEVREHVVGVVQRAGCGEDWWKPIMDGNASDDHLTRLFRVLHGRAHDPDALAAAGWVAAYATMTGMTVHFEGLYFVLRRLSRVAVEEATPGPTLEVSERRQCVIACTGMAIKLHGGSVVEPWMQQRVEWLPLHERWSARGVPEPVPDEMLVQVGTAEALAELARRRTLPRNVTYAAIWSGEYLHLPYLGADTFKAVRVLWHSSYYDGIVSGVCEYDGKRCWFDVVDQPEFERWDEDEREWVHDWTRRFVIFEMASEDLAREEERHAKFREHVGTHTEHDEDGVCRGTVRPSSEHHKFYDWSKSQPPRDLRGYTKGKPLAWFGFPAQPDEVAGTAKPL